MEQPPSPTPESNLPRKPRMAQDDSPPPAPELDPARVNYGFKRADVTPVNTNELPAVDPYDILEINARARAAHRDEKPIEIPRGLSRRARDYWTLMIPLNLIGGGIIYLFRDNMVILLFGGSGLLMFDIGLSWLTWVVMSRD